MSERVDAAAAAIVVAGGTGERFGAVGGKQLACVAGFPVLTHTLRALGAVPAIGFIAVVCHPERLREYREAAVEPAGLTVPVEMVGGGSTRTDSVRNGLAVIPGTWAHIVVHDGARPLVLPDTVARVLDALVSHPDADGYVVGQPSSDTLKEVVGDRVLSTADRSRFWAIQTPQAFRSQALRDAYERPRPPGPVTDDASLVEAAGGLVRVIEGPRDNIKVTLAEDLAIVESVLRFRGLAG